MNKSNATNYPAALLVLAGRDRFGERRGLGISTINFKVTPQDKDGILIIENTFHEKGGPARHLHYNQDEWFYITAGEFLFEAGEETYRLNPGDSLLAPRRVPHVWVFSGEGIGSVLIAFLPAGKMEPFFREVTKANAMPPQDPEMWRAHEMDLLGPPLLISVPECEERIMTSQQNTRPSLENLIEREDFGFEILHPGDLEITQELANLCKIEKRTTVLDIASGTGETACYLAEKLGARVVGVDGSDLMIERAKEKAKQRNLSIEFEKGDAHHLPYGDNTFDAVISECTMCLLDKEAAIREMVRVAKPGGYVGFHDICWKAGTPEHMKKRLAEIEEERPELLKDWKRLCEIAGLVEVQAIDRSALIPVWMKDTTQKLSPSMIAKLVLKVIRLWGISGLMEIWESERIFQSKHTGYGILVGRKPLEEDA